MFYVTQLILNDKESRVRQHYYLYCMRFATISVSLLILIALLLPGNDLPGIRIGNWDKAIHFTMFACWAVALRYDYRATPFPFRRMLLVGAIFALSTEILQTWVEGRNFDLYDLVADIAGLVVGGIVSSPVIRWAEYMRKYLLGRQGKP